MKEKNGIAAFVTTWIYLENIMLSKISHTEKNNVQSHLKKKKKSDIET